MRSRPRFWDGGVYSSQQAGRGGEGSGPGCARVRWYVPVTRGELGWLAGWWTLLRAGPLASTVACRGHFAIEIPVARPCGRPKQACTR